MAVNAAEELTAAASRLRALAEAATPGPWRTECVGSEGWHVFGPCGLDERHPPRRPRVSAVTWGSFESDKADAAYIAAMSPPVALAVAELLDAAAQAHEYAVTVGGRGLADDDAALAVARAINHTEAS
ncbi:MAG TPA: hypothetical protein VFJ14_06820 [Nocardioidaceae bacterium]|nr:hypothetical protein [Nocardioidaceae bacterium]